LAESAGNLFVDSCAWLAIPACIYNIQLLPLRSPLAYFNHYFVLISEINSFLSPEPSLEPPDSHCPSSLPTAVVFQNQPSSLDAIAI
jgi:hypothetical protein